MTTASGASNVAGQMWRRKRIRSQSRVLSALFYVVLFATLLPYHFNRSDLQQIIYFLVISLIGVLGVTLTLNRRVLAMLSSTMRYNWHVMLYFSVYVISHIALIVVDGDFNLQQSALVVAYLCIGMTTLLIIPLGIVNGLLSLDRLLAFAMIIGVLTSSVGVFVAFTGKGEFLGIPVRQLSLTSIGIYANSSVFFESNRFAVVTMFGGMASVYLASRSGWSHRHLGAVLICLAGTFVSWSRSTLLAFVMVLFIFFVMIGQKRIQNASRSVLSLIVLVMLYVIVSQQDNLLSYLYGQGWALRDELWPAAIRAISQRPFFGHGAGNEIDALNAIYRYSGYYEVIHSTILSLGFYSGVPAAMAYLLVYVVAVFRLRDSELDRSTTILYLSVIISSFVISLSLDYHLGGAAYGAVMICIFLGLASLAPLATELSTVHNDPRTGNKLSKKPLPGTNFRTQSRRDLSRKLQN